VLKKILKFLVFLTALLAMLVVAILPAVAFLRIISPQNSPEKIQVRVDSPARLYYGFYLWLHRDELHKPASPEGSSITFTVYPGESPFSVGERLEEAGIISNARLFYAYIRYHDLGHKLEAGDYTLSPGMTIPDIVQALQHGRIKEIVLTIPEGWRVEELADYLEKKGLMSAKEFLALAQRDLWVADYDFLKEAPEGVSLEGYLFPDTYRLPVPASPGDLITRMLDNFSVKVTPEMRARAQELKATGRWWPSITIEEMSSVQSPYNTFLNPGLPPGPICSPGLDSIKAVLYPAETDYLFFFSRGDGSHVFSKTYEEHLENQKRYGR